MKNVKYILWLVIIYSCAANKKINYSKKSISNIIKPVIADTLSEQNLKGYFLIYRAPIEKTDNDVTHSRELYDVFYLLNQKISVTEFSSFRDTMLLDTKNYIGISTIYGNSIWASLKSERDSLSQLLEKKYSFSILQGYNLYSIIANSIPKELINSDKAFVSIFEGNLFATENVYSAEHNFSNMTANNYGTSSTYLLLPNNKNSLQYRFSVLLK
jgi:uncharacterized protein with NRDE domain